LAAFDKPLNFMAFSLERRVCVIIARKTRAKAERPLERGRPCLSAIGKISRTGPVAIGSLNNFIV